MHPSSNEQGPTPAPLAIVRVGRGALYLLLSLCVHAALILFVWASADAEDERPLIRFKLPAEADFGVVDGTGEPAESASPPPAPPPKMAEKPTRKKRDKRPKVTAVTPDDNAFGPALDASVPDPDESGEVSDAAVAQGPARDGGAALRSGIGVVPGATGDGLGVGAGGHGLGGFAPPGAHVGLHVNVRRVADSSLILEVRSLLNVIPGWQDLLEDSGLDPMRHLKQLFVATPDLRPRSLVVSARFAKNSKLIEKAVARLAKRRGAQAPWGERSSVRSAPWYGADGTPRVIALVEDGQFVITREEDLSRVISVVRILESRSGEASKVDRRAPKDLVQQFKDEAVALSIEDTGKFVEGDVPGMPKRLRLSVKSLDEFHAGLSVIGQYPSKGDAATALAYLRGLRERLFEHPKVKFLGMVSALETLELKQDDRYVVLTAKLTMHQTRFLLDYVAEIMRPQAH